MVGRGDSTFKLGCSREHLDLQNKCIDTCQKIYVLNYYYILITLKKILNTVIWELQGFEFNNTKINALRLQYFYNNFVTNSRKLLLILIWT